MTGLRWKSHYGKFSQIVRIAGAQVLQPAPVQTQIIGHSSRKSAACTLASRCTIEAGPRSVAVATVMPSCGSTANAKSQKRCHAVPGTTTWADIRAATQLVRVLYRRSVRAILQASAQRRSHQLRHR
ncbi:MAG: hypothetical protein EOO23_02845 [Comamonadaceae bacterium]|nr:MAG: hypothetical protein EOO23_02845 [Comamonadaceae bacterium]